MSEEGRERNAIVIWDHDAFYDLQTDPHERHNLINVPVYKETGQCQVLG